MRLKLLLSLLAFAILSCTKEDLTDGNSSSDDYTYTSDFAFAEIEGVEELFDELEVLNMQGGTIYEKIFNETPDDENLIDFTEIDFTEILSYINPNDGAYSGAVLEEIDMDAILDGNQVSSESDKSIVHNTYLLDIYYLSCKWRQDGMKDDNLADIIMKSVKWYMENYAPESPMWYYTFRLGDYSNEEYNTSILGNLDRILINMYPFAIEPAGIQYYTLFYQIIDYADNTINEAAGAQNRGLNWSGRIPVVYSHFLLKYKFFGQYAVNQFKYHLHDGFTYDLDQVGTLPDGGFWHHGTEPYCLPYGQGDFYNATDLLYYFEGTPFAFSQEHYAVYEKQFIDKWAEIIVGDRYMDLAIVGGKNAAQYLDYKARLGDDGLAPFAEALQRLDPNMTTRSSETDAIMSRINSGSEVFDNTRSNKWYGYWEYMLHRRPGWYIGYKGISSNTETSEWDLNFYLASGCASILQRGDEYWKVRPALDWTALPGTTAEQHDYSYMTGCSSLGSDAFCGGATSYKESETDEDVGIYAFNLAHRFNAVGSVEAKKCAIFVNRGLIHLTTGIKRVSNLSYKEIWTSLDTRELSGNIVCKFNGSTTTVGSTGESGQSVTITENSYVWHDGIGYFIIASQEDPKNIIIKSVNRSGVASDVLSNSPDTKYDHDIFTLAINHGYDPEDDSAIYFAFPGVAQSEMDGLLEDINNETEFSILRNDSDVQAVYDHTLNRTFFAFRSQTKLEVPSYLYNNVEYGNDIESMQSIVGIATRAKLKLEIILGDPYKLENNLNIIYNNEQRTISLYSDDTTMGRDWYQE